MRLNTIEQKSDRFFISITFEDEIKEQQWLKTVIDFFKESGLQVNCEITDLDTGCHSYEEFFETNYYLYDRLTTISLFAFDLTNQQICDVVNNWGFYSIDAIFALGSVNDVNELKKERINLETVFLKMPIVVRQVLDTTVDITIDSTYKTDLMQMISNSI